MQTTILPRGIASSIDKSIQNFLWGDMPIQHHVHLINWETVTKPKVFGGLGIRDSKTTNEAFHMNQAWRVWRNPNTLLTKFLSQKHCQTSDFIRTTSHTGSHSWKALLRGRNLLWSGLRWVVHNGWSVNFWTDHFLPLGPIWGLIHGPLFPQEYEFNVARMINANHQWDCTPLCMVLPPTITEYIYAQSLPIPCSQPSLDDDCVWNHHAGICSVKSAYHSLLPMSNGGPMRSTEKWSWIWKLKPEDTS